MNEGKPKDNGWLIHFQRYLDTLPCGGIYIIQVKIFPRDLSKAPLCVVCTSGRHATHITFSPSSISYLCFTAFVNSQHLSPPPPKPHSFHFLILLLFHPASPPPPASPSFSWFLGRPSSCTDPKSYFSVVQGRGVDHAPASTLFVAAPPSHIHEGTHACSRLAAQAVIDG